MLKRSVIFLTLTLALNVNLLAFATEEVVAPNVRVLYTDEAVAPYAQRVAAKAEDALEVLIPLFGAPERPIVINLRNDTDVFNAFATPLPRPSLGVRALFPVNGTVGYRASDPLLLLLLHELTHIEQLTYTKTKEGEEEDPLRFGLVGEGVATVPPTWLLEGIATWVESEYTDGGRLEDGVTVGLLETLAVSEDWPTLTEAGLADFDGWPGGSTRYLLGAAFLDYLIDKHEFEAVLATLRAYNGGGLFRDFSGAWRRAVETDLAAEWAAWRQSLVARAESRAAREETRLTDSGWYTGLPAVSPDGSRIAWVGWSPEINVATFKPDADAPLQDRRTLIDERFPEKLSWLDDDTLLYSRTVSSPAGRYLELFTLDAETGQERQLTSGSRAHFPAATPDGCVLYVQDDGLNSRLQTWCKGVIETVWEPPTDWHIVGLSVSPAGQIALSVWRQGFADVALLEDTTLTFLTQDRAQDLEPTWADENTLLFSSDREGDTFEVYSLDLDNPESVTQQTQTLGGAFQPAGVSGGFLYSSLSSEGYDLAFQTSDPVQTLALEAEEIPTVNVAEQDFETRTYLPFSSLAPYGWLPFNITPSFSLNRLALGATVLAQDDSGEHSYALTGGYAGGLDGVLGSFYSYATYRYRANSVFNELVPPYPVGFGVQGGVWLHNPHLLATTETAAGVQGTLQTTLPLDRWTVRGNLTAGLLYLTSYEGWQPDLRLGVEAEQQDEDLWTYRTDGAALGVAGVLSATPTGSSLGAWGNATYFTSLPVFEIGGTAELGLRAGYRQSPPFPLTLEEFAAVGGAGYRVNIPTELRYGDGRYALERITVEPRLRGWFDGTLGVGGDLSVNADLLLNYAGPVSFGVTVGYAQGFWSRVGVRLPL